MAKPVPSTCLFHLIASPFIQLLYELSSISYFHQVYLPSPKYNTNLTTSHGLCHLCLGPGLHLLSSPQIHPQDPSFHMYPPPVPLPLRLMTLQARAIFFLKKICFFSFGCAGSCLLRVGFSLIAASRGYSLVALLGLLIAVASHVAEHGLWVHGLHYLWFPGSRAQTLSLWHTSLFAPQHVGSPHARDWTGVSCIAVDHQGSPRATVLHPGVDYVILLLKTLQWLPNEFSIRADHPPPLTMVNRPGTTRCNNLIPA